MLSQLTPSPAPTVTVTETVTTTPSPPPTIYVKVPDGWDASRDVWLSDFGGALLGAVAALIVALIVVWFDRRARREDRRLTLAGELMSATDTLMIALDVDSTQAELKVPIASFSFWSARIVAIYGNTYRHRRYAEWLH